MKTEKLTTTEAAARLLAEGKLVAFPTETVFGIGADATSTSAVLRVFEAKGRPSNNPLIVHIADVSHWRLAARELTASAKKFFDAFAPGPITLVLPKNPSICSLATAGLDSVGLRIPSCGVARDMLRMAKLPIAAPSANQSGRPSCTSWESVLEDLDGRIDAILCLNTQVVGLESTVVACCGEVPVMLRPGAITLEDLRGVIAETEEFKPVTEMSESVAGNQGRLAARSPGLLHPHYRPNAEIQLLEWAAESIATGQLDHSATAYGGLARHPDAERLLLHRQFESLSKFAEEFYEFLRSADRQGAQVILLELSPETGIGIALRDRQLRAAGLK